MVFRWFNILNYILPWVDLKKNLENLRDMLFSTLKSAIISKIQIISLWMVDISTDTCYSNWTCVMCSIALVHIFTTRAFLPPPHKRCIILHTKYMNAKHARLLLLLPPPSPSPPIHRHQVFNYPPCTSSAVNACTHTHKLHYTILFAVCGFIGKNLFGRRSERKTARITSFPSAVSDSVGDSISMGLNRWQIFSSCLFIFLCWFSFTDGLCLRFVNSV